MKSKREKYLECTKKSKNPSFHTLGEQSFQSKGKKSHFQTNKRVYHQQTPSQENLMMCLKKKENNQRKKMFKDQKRINICVCTHIHIFVVQFNSNH